MEEITKSFSNRTHSKKIRGSEEFHREENYFDRLPTDLIISIFERILDAKCLCICYSVSKYFAAHVVQTRLVSVEIPHTIGQSGGFPVWPQGVMNFLKKLGCVESATIRFSLRNRSPSSSKQPLVWWKSDSFGFIFVCAERRDITSNNHTRESPPKEKHDVFSSIIDHLCEFRSRFRYVKELVDALPILKNISAVDSIKQGNIVVDEEGIASMKTLGGCRKLCRKLWIAPKVKLSHSGCVMKNVAVIVTREIGASEADNLLEENEYGEVAMTMMKKRAFSKSLNSSTRGTIADVSYMSYFNNVNISIQTLGRCPARSVRRVDPRRPGPEK